MINRLLIFLALILPNCYMDKGSTLTQIVAQKFTNKMKTYGLNPTGIGEGINHDTKKQNYFSVIFTIEILPNIETARILIVQALKTLKNEIDSEERIRAYLDAYPYPMKYMQVSILSENENEGLWGVKNFEDKIIYKVNNPDLNIGMPIEIFQETFEEALQKVNCSR